MSYIINVIESVLCGRDEYGTYIFKDISILEKNEDDIELFPIFGIDVEVDEKEIALVSNGLGKNSDVWGISGTQDH